MFPGPFSITNTLQYIQKISYLPKGEESSEKERHKPPKDQGKKAGLAKDSTHQSTIQDMSGYGGLRKRALAATANKNGGDPLKATNSNDDSQTHNDDEPMSLIEALNSLENTIKKHSLPMKAGSSNPTGFVPPPQSALSKVVTDAMAKAHQGTPPGLIHVHPARRSKSLIRGDRVS